MQSAVLAALAAVSGLLLLPAAPLSAQPNFVTNGDFAQGLQGWTMAGWADTPQVEPFDTTGLGTSSAFGCSPGNNQAPFLTLSQPVLAAAGVFYEFRADVALDGNFNQDGGTITVRLGGNPVASHAFGQVALGGELRRDVLCSRFPAPASGNLVLEIEFSRQFGASFGRTPRNYIDNVSLRFSPGPVFCIRGDRKLGNTVEQEVAGTPMAGFSVFLAASTLPQPIAIPGVSGEWGLALAPLFVFSTGLLDASGAFSAPLPLPSDPALHQVPLWFQALQADGQVLALGPHNNYGLFR